MILDPNRDGVELFYDDKILNLVGNVEKCVDYVISLTCDIFEYESTKELYDKKNVFKYNGKYYELLTKLYVDTNGIGRCYSDYLDQFRIPYSKVEVKRINV